MSPAKGMLQSRTVAKKIAFCSPVNHQDAMNRLLHPFIIDVEASGFGPAGYPIEVGLALEKGSRYCRLIVPAEDWTHWDEKAEATHGIRREILFKNGIPPDQAAAELNDLLGESVVYTDGWVVDKPWINRLFDAAGIRRLFGISPLERILSEEQMDIWHATKDHLIQTLNTTRHRASNDAFIIQETYIQTLKTLSVQS